MTKEKSNAKRQWFWERPAFKNSLILLIIFGGGIMLLLALVLGCKVLRMWWGGAGLEESYESVRNLIFSIGGVGAAIGLWFADRRQEKFSAQVDVQTAQMEAQAKQVQVLSEQVRVQSKQVEAHVEQVDVQSKQVQVLSEQVKVQADQSFNERLGRGVELLAKDNVIMRTAGFSILVDLAHNATDAQKPIVGNIIYDFFHEKVKIKRDNDDDHSEERTGRDVKNALDFLINLSLDEREKLLPKRLIDDRLNFSDLDFSQLDIASQTLESIDFSFSRIDVQMFKVNIIIKNVDFSDSTIENAIFFGAEISNSDFNRGEMIDCHFENCDIEESTFIDKTLEGMDIDDAVSVKFVGGEFVEGKIEISSTSGVPYFICTDLTDTNFNFGDDLDDGIDINKYFKSCYYKKGQRPLAKMDASREYETIGGMDVFILPEKDSEKQPWSGQPASEWVAVEVAQWRLEYIKSLPSWQRDEKMIGEIESKLERAERALRKIQKELNLPKKTPDLNPNQKNHRSQP